MGIANEIGKEKDDVQNNIRLIVSNDLREDLLNSDKLDSYTNIFIDEFSVNTDKDLETIDDISKKIDQSNS